MKYNKIFLIMVLFGLLFSSTAIYADDSIIKNAAGAATNQAVTAIMGDVFSIFTGAITGITADPILTGLVGAAASTYTSLKGLDETWKFEMAADRVNISDRKEEFIDEKSFSKLKIDPDKEMIITDKNILDVDFKETVKDLTTYKDDKKNPTLRVTEKTEIVSVLDSNSTKVDAQKRGLLFEDPNLTIKDAYEYRTLLIRYNEATYKTQPLKVSIDGISGGWDIYKDSFYQIFSSGAASAKNLISKKVLNFDVSDKGEIPVEKTQKFHLLFNSRVDDNVTIDNSLLDCVSEDGRQIGTTGKDELPKLVFNWDFLEGSTGSPQSISGDNLNRNTWCDIDSDGVYCDATQFSIEVLHKIKSINEYVNEFKSCFTCPVNFKEQQLVSEKNNTGLIYLSGDFPEDLSNFTFNYKIKGNYETEPDAISASKPLFKINYIIEKKSLNSYNWSTIISGTLKEVPLSYLSEGGFIEEEKTIKLPTKPSEDDIIKITLSISEFNTIIEEYETGNNILDNSLDMEISQGTEACNFETTSSNLLKYSQGCDKKYNEKLSNFKVSLQKDGYSNDFRNDFDKHYRFTLFQTPNWYSESQSEYGPLHKYFTDKDNFIFKSDFSESIAETGIPGPGRYAVEIEIKYDNKWQLFNQAGDLTGTINVILNKEQGPERDSPIYYMPINGVIGSTDDKTRNGYGVSYMGDIVSIDHIFNQGKPLNTEGFISQNTINTIDTKEISDFSIMSTGDTRGKLLEIQKLSNKISLKYIPSRATSVVMSVTNNTVNTDAFAFYKLSLGLPIGEGGDLANPGRSLTTWTGFSQCNDFTGVSLLERFLGTEDIVSVDSQLAPITQSQGFSYGVEWPKNRITRAGTVWLYTIFYTPTNLKNKSYSHLYRDSVNDSLKFYVGELGTSGTDVVLKNSLGDDKDIKSIKAIFDLVKDKKACINYDGSTLDVFYNPKEISKPLTDLIDTKLEENINNSGSEYSCIRN